jgi:hypothetical protein
MNHPDRNPSTVAQASGSAEETLRLIAGLPAPVGLEDRVNIGLRTARRTGLVLSWPQSARAGGEWMRGAAAAAIVFVVVGGGWGVYSRVQKPQAATVIVMPHTSTPGGFSNAGAMRTPNPLNGPVVAQPVTVRPAQAKPPAKAGAKPAPLQGARASAANKDRGQTVAP